jgi:diguanylate cyclase (GGDEF)-like protein/PAS domain S-box-containing protein
MPNSKLNRLRLVTIVTIGVFGTVLVTMLTLLLIVHHFAKSYATEQAQQRLQQLSWQMRDALNHGILEVVENARFVSQLRQVRESNNTVELRMLFDNVEVNFANYAWIGLTDRDGKVVAASHGALEGHDVKERPWFIEGQKKLFIGDYHAAMLLEPLLPYSEERWRFVDVSLPITRPDGSYRGVLGVHLSWEWVRKVANDLLIPADNQYMAEILVVRDDDTIILGPDYLEETKVRVPSIDLAQSGHTGAVTEEWPDGRRYITGYSRTGLGVDYAPAKWSILIRQPEEIALATFRDLEHQILIAGGVIGLLLALIAVGLARQLARPLDELSAAIVRHRSDGVLQMIPITSEYHEVHLLSTTLSEMIDRERQHVSNLQMLNENLEHLVQERTREIEQKAQALEESLARQMDIQMRLQDSEAELRATLQNANDAFIAMDQNGVIVDWNEQAERQLGWTRGEAIGQKMSEMIIPLGMRSSHAKGMQRFLKTGETNVINRRIEIVALRRDGIEFPIELNVACVPRHEGHLFIAFLHDITERQLLQASLTGMALKDPLTDLPNRRALMQKLPEAMARASRVRKPLAVFFLDLDGFKGVNDGYGHEAGDELLRTMAQRILGIVRTTDMVARLAGDEFVVVLEMQNSEDTAADVADKILDTIQQPFALTAATVSLTASIGIAMYWPEDQATPDQLITRADGAMYAAKKNGKNRAVAV